MIVDNFFNILLSMLKLIKFRRLLLKAYSLGKRISQNTKIMALICQKSSIKYKWGALVVNKLLNIKTALVDAYDIIMGYQEIVKKMKKIEDILTKFLDQRLCKKSMIRPFL